MRTLVLATAVLVACAPEHPDYGPSVDVDGFQYYPGYSHYSVNEVHQVIQSVIIALQYKGYYQHEIAAAIYAADASIIAVEQAVSWDDSTPDPLDTKPVRGVTLDNKLAFVTVEPRCAGNSAMAHELVHIFAYQLIGDGDNKHQNPVFFGPTGVSHIAWILSKCKE